MLYPKEDKENKMLLYAVSVSKFDSVNVLILAITTLINLFLVKC